MSHCPFRRPSKENRNKAMAKNYFKTKTDLYFGLLSNFIIAINILLNLLTLCFYVKNLCLGLGFIDFKKSSVCLRYARQNDKC